MKQEDVHKRRRRFIGPLPATVVEAEPKRAQKPKHPHSLLRREHDGDDDTSSSDDDDSSNLSEVIRRHALEFFLRHGGQRDNWGESQQKSVRKEMRKRWRQSDWGRARKQRQVGNTQKWIGSSFDIGVFLGVDIMDETFPATSSQADTSVASAPATPPAISVLPTPSAAETFVTAPSHVDPTEGTTGSPLLTSTASREQGSSKVSITSTTALVPSSSYLTPEVPTTRFADAEQYSEVAGPPPQTQANGNYSTASLLAPSLKGKEKGKGKAKDIHVHYEESPAPPSEVLARTGSAVKVTSAGAVEQTTIEASTKWGDVIMRGGCYTSTLE